MKFDIARQSLVPAFLTLLVIAVSAMFGVTGVHTSADETALPLLGGQLMRFQAACPFWAHLIAGVAIVVTALSVGRVAVRYNLYAVGSCLPIPLYGLIACGTGIGGDYLAGFLSAMLLALAVKNYCRASGNRYSFDALFRASLYAGLLPLVYAPATPLVVILLPVVWLFRRTLREIIVALAGLVLPMLVACYLSWGAGNGFAAPLYALIGILTAPGAWFSAFMQLPLAVSAMLGLIGLLTLVSVFFFIRNLYATGVKSRTILVFNIFVAVFAVALFCAPFATTQLLVLLAVPLALLLPLFFVRIHSIFASILYLVWIAVIFAVHLLE